MSVVESLAGRLKAILHSVQYSGPMEPDFSQIIESDFDHNLRKPSMGVPATSLPNTMDMSISRNGNVRYSAEGEVCEALHVCQEIQLDLEAAFTEWSEKNSNVRLVFPKDLTAQISEDIVRMSVAEPCGVRGCAIYVRLQEKDRCYKLTSVFCNSSAPPTFEIYLTLKEDFRAWQTLQKAFLTVKSCVLNNKLASTLKIVSQAYQLEKRRLYRR